MSNSSRFGRTKTKVLGLAAGLIAVAGVTFIVLWPAILGHIRAGMLLESISGNRVRAMQSYIGGVIDRSTVQIPSSTAPITAHLYRRARGTKGEKGIVLVHGFSPTGDRYDTLIQAANNLASSGFVVLTPTIPPLTHYLIDREGMQMIGESAVWLSKETGSPVTVLGISFSGGLAMVAAVQPQYRSGFRQVISLSSYDDLRRISYFYVTGVEPEPGGGTIRVPYTNPFAVDITALQFVRQFVPPEDVVPVSAAIEDAIRRMQNPNVRDVSAPVVLSPRQRQEVDEILAGGQAIRSKLLGALKQPNRDLEQLSPHVNMASLTVPLTVLSGFDDPAIPSAESNWLEADVPAGRLCRVYFSPLIHHVTLSSPTRETGVRRLRRWMDKWLLMSALAPAMEGADPHVLFPGCS
jgi:hypothetical protein